MILDASSVAHCMPWRVKLATAAGWHPLHALRRQPPRVPGKGAMGYRDGNGCVCGCGTYNALACDTTFPTQRRFTPRFCEGRLQHAMAAWPRPSTSAPPHATDADLRTWALWQELRRSSAALACHVGRADNARRLDYCTVHRCSRWGAPRHVMNKLTLSVDQPN